MAQLWVEHLSILSDNIYKPRCFLICFYGVVFVARAITRKKIRTEAISIRLNSLPSYLGSLWWLRLNKTLASNLKWLRQVPRFASYYLRPGRVPWKFLLWLSKLFFSPPSYLLFLWPNRKSNADITSTKTSCLRCRTIYPPSLNFHRGNTKTTYIYRHEVKSNHRSLLCTPSV